MKSIIILLVFLWIPLCLLSGNLTSQEDQLNIQREDSLAQVVESSSNDSIKFVTYIELIKLLANDKSKFDELSQYLDSAQLLFHKFPNSPSYYLLLNDLNYWAGHAFYYSADNWQLSLGYLNMIDLSQNQSRQCLLKAAIAENLGYNKAATLNYGNALNLSLHLHPRVARYAIVGLIRGYLRLDSAASHMHKSKANSIKSLFYSLCDEALKDSGSSDLISIKLKEIINLIPSGESFGGDSIQSELFSLIAGEQFKISKIQWALSNLNAAISAAITKEDSIHAFLTGALGFVFLKDAIKSKEYLQLAQPLTEQTSYLLPKYHLTKALWYYSFASKDSALLGCVSEFQILKKLNHPAQLARDSVVRMIISLYNKSGRIEESARFHELLMESYALQKIEQSTFEEFETISDIEYYRDFEDRIFIQDRITQVAIYAVIFIIFLLLIAIALVLRNRFIKKTKAIIQSERDKSNNLLLNILPQEVAEELKEKGKTDAKGFDIVSILFTDFKGFTERSSTLNPTELINELNVCFRAFDGIIEKHEIEKIKTIGDAYMAAGGIPTPNPKAVKSTILAALDMQAFIEQRKQERESNCQFAFRMRAGIHTGPVVAGIVGVKKFQYDLWGDTVNTASRMETNGEVGKVNISNDTYELIKDDPDFTFESRGKIDVKGKGEMLMWFVSKA